MDRTWWTAFALFAALSAAWAIATPIFAAPDEPVHVVRAWSVAHGELVGKDLHRDDPLLRGQAKNADEFNLVVDAPEIYRSSGNVACLAFQPVVAANCLHLDGSQHRVRTLTSVGRYFPAYYALVGSVSWFTHAGGGQVYLMRLVGALAASALLASAFVTARRRASRSLVTLGLVVAVTPMVLFLAGTVNPSGLEIAAAIAVWVHGSALARDAAEEVEPRLVTALGIATLVLAVSRPTSPLYVLIAGLALALLAGRAGIRAVWRSARCRVWMAVIAAAVAVHLVWNLRYATYDASHYVGSPVDDSTARTLRTTFGKSFSLLHQMIGWFGWFDTPSPSLTLVIWIAAVAVLLAVGLVVAPRSWSYVVGLLVLLTIVVPVVLESLEANRVGYIWSGRYTLPLAVGVPIVAAAGSRVPRGLAEGWNRFLRVFVVALALAQLLAFAQALRRYSVGADGDVWFFAHARWNPPIPGGVLVLAYTGLVAVALWWMGLRPLASARPASAPLASGESP